MGDQAKSMPVEFRSWHWPDGIKDNSMASLARRRLKNRIFVSFWKLPECSLRNKHFCRKQSLQPSASRKREGDLGQERPLEVSEGWRLETTWPVFYKWDWSQLAPACLLCRWEELWQHDRGWFKDTLHRGGQYCGLPLLVPSLWDFVISSGESETEICIRVQLTMWKSRDSPRWSRKPGKGCVQHPVLGLEQNCCKFFKYSEFKTWIS